MKKTLLRLLPVLLLLFALTAGCAVTARAAEEVRPDEEQNRVAYHNGGFTLEIEPRYNELVTVQTPENDERGILITVSETASLETGRFEGAGWLFSIGTVSEERLHEMLCADMSGAQVFAKDADGRYFMYYHPTDVRYVRATPEDMAADQDQWSELNEWARTEVCADILRYSEGLTPVNLDSDSN